jgi:hypothetical protein
MPQTQKYTDTFIITYKLFLVGLRGHYFISNPDGRPCIFKFLSKHLWLSHLYDVQLFSVDTTIYFFMHLTFFLPMKP